MSESNHDMQGFTNQQEQKLKSGMLPLMMFTEEMYRANFILDKWLKRKYGLN
jgi:hypothetical protein